MFYCKQSLTSTHWAIHTVCNLNLHNNIWNEIIKTKWNANMKLKQTLKSVCHKSLLEVIIILIASGIVVKTHYAYDIDSVNFMEVL